MRRAATLPRFSTQRSTAATNQLIDLLPRQSGKRLLAAATSVELVLAEVMCKAGEPARYVYFPTAGYISLVAVIEGSPGVEVGMVGAEGLLGAHLVVADAPSPLHALVQGPGAAWRIGARAFREQLAQDSALRNVLGRYVHVGMVQLCTSAACLRFHEIGPRLARWLLMSHDRAGAATFRVTHEFLAYMLGVRRAGITRAAVELQREGLIAYRRGDLTVLDRAGLEAASCGCYAADRRHYDESLSDLPRRRR